MSDFKICDNCKDKYHKYCRLSKEQILMSCGLKGKKKTLTTEQIYSNGEKLFDAAMGKPNRIMCKYVKSEIERKKKAGKK